MVAYRDKQPGHMYGLATTVVCLLVVHPRSLTVRHWKVTGPQKVRIVFQPSIFQGQTRCSTSFFHNLLEVRRFLLETHHFLGVKTVSLPECTLQGTKQYPPKNGILSRWFSELPKVGYVSIPWRVSFLLPRLSFSPTLQPETTIHRDPWLWRSLRSIEAWKAVKVGWEPPTIQHGCQWYPKKKPLAKRNNTHTHTKKNKGCNLVKKQALSDHRSWSWLKFLVNFCFVLKQARFGTGSMARALGLALVGCFFSLGGPVLTRRRLQRLQMVARGAGEEWRWNWEICRGIQDLWMESWQWKRPGWWDWMVLVLDWIY